MTSMLPLLRCPGTVISIGVEFDFGIRFLVGYKKKVRLQDFEGQ